MNMNNMNMNNMNIINNNNNNCIIRKKGIKRKSIISGHINNDSNIKVVFPLSNHNLNNMKLSKKIKKTRKPVDPEALRKKIEDGLKDIRYLEELMRFANDSDIWPALRSYMKCYTTWTMQPRSIRFKVNHMELVPAPLRIEKWDRHISLLVTIPNIINRTALQRRIFVRFEDSIGEKYDIELRVGTEQQFERVRERDTVIVKQHLSETYTLKSRDNNMAMEVTYLKEQKSSKLMYEVISNPRTKVINVYFCSHVDQQLRINLHSNNSVAMSSIKMLKIDNNKLVPVNDFEQPIFLTSDNDSLNSNNNNKPMRSLTPSYMSEKNMEDLSDSEILSENNESFEKKLKSLPAKKEKRSNESYDNVIRDSIMSDDISFLGFLANDQNSENISEASVESPASVVSTDSVSLVSPFWLQSKDSSQAWSTTPFHPQMKEKTVLTAGPFALDSFLL